MNNELISWQSTLVESDLVDLVRHPGQAIDMDSINAEAKERLWRIAERIQNIDGQETIDSLGWKLLPYAIDGDVCYRRPPEYWEQLKREFQLFVCAKDKKYAALRKKLAKSAKKSQTVIVSSIAAAMAAQFGVVAGVLVPFCAMCLIVLLRIGKEAFCASTKWDTPLVAKKTRSRNMG
ncbi:MAG: hypothetical protein WCE90_07110 [Candidatus Zixiibacteriota bacterium]